VRITAGNAALAPTVDDSPVHDVVAMDDFIYGEPQAHPTAVTLRSVSAARTGRGVQIRWRTGTAASTAGFAIYREMRGRLVRVNRNLVAAAPQAIEAAYSFVDRAAPRSGPIRYWIRAVSLGGSSSSLGSVVAR
jgi:hypothetical protein